VEECKSFAELYLPSEIMLVDKLYQKIIRIIKEKKKIPYLDSDGNPKDEFLEYFNISETEISFNRRGGNKNKWKVKPKDVKDAIRYALRSDIALNRKNYNKMYGPSNFVGTPLYLFVNIVNEDIEKHQVVGLELTHNQFGIGIISDIDKAKNILSFKFGEESKPISMDFFQLSAEDQGKIAAKLSDVLQ